MNNYGNSEQGQDDASDRSCDYCNKRAVLNQQTVRIVWAMRPSDGYSTAFVLREAPGPVGPDNEHVCEEHGLRELGGSCINELKGFDCVPLLRLLSRAKKYSPEAIAFVKVVWQEITAEWNAMDPVESDPGEKG